MTILCVFAVITKNEYFIYKSILWVELLNNKHRLMFIKHNFVVLNIQNIYFSVNNLNKL